MKITSEIIQLNLIKLEKAFQLFPILIEYKNLTDKKNGLIHTGLMYSPAYNQTEDSLRNVRDEAKTYKLNIYLDFIDFILNTKRFDQEVFYKKKIKNLDLQNILIKFSIDEDAKKVFRNKTKASFQKFINSPRWLTLSGENYTRRSKKRFNDNMYRSSAMIANYCIQNEIEIDNENIGRVKNWYTKLLSDPDLSISKEVERTKSIIDFVIEKLNEGESDFRKVNLDHLSLTLKNELRKRILSLQNGDRIKCINVISENLDELTLNKVYEVVSSSLDNGSLKVEIKNDCNKNKFYYFRDFETISVLRDSFIDELLNDI
jgi:hypothetical protein